MAQAFRAGVIYVAIVFAIGFVLGTIRVLFLVPRLGETRAVWIELPLMLALSWTACSVLVRRFAVPPTGAARLTMGAVAFALLMLGELGVSMFAFGRTVAEHIAVYATPQAQLGLVAQIAFALFPLVQAALSRKA